MVKVVNIVGSQSMSRIADHRESESGTLLMVRAIYSARLSIYIHGITSA